MNCCCGVLFNGGASWPFPIRQGKVVPVHTVKVYWRSGGVGPHIPNLDSRWTYSFITF